MRYLRADTSPKAKCPTCGEQLLHLRWGHESRCESFVDRQRARSLRAAFAVLILALVFLALPAHAQSIDPSKLADDFNTKALATMAVVELIAIAWLARALLASFEKRLEEGQRAHAQTLETHGNVVKLGLQTTEAVEVLGEAVEHVTRRDP